VVIGSERIKTMGVFDRITNKRLTESTLDELSFKCCGTVLSCYDHLNDRGLMQDDETKLTILFKIVGIVLLYTDFQIYASRRPTVGSEVIEKLLRLVSSALASGMAKDPQYRLKALSQPYVNVGGVEIETSAYLVGEVQEVFKRYGETMDKEGDPWNISQQFADDLYDDLGVSKNDESRFHFRLLVPTSLVSMDLKKLLDPS
jgi:hypothetical protein